MNQAGRGASERTSDEVVTESGNVKVEDDDRVYVTAGEVIAGKYRVERILGVGGMGFVVAATHVQLDGAFALKFLKKRFLHDNRVVDRFTREAKAACRIRSEYVARVFDVGTQEGAPYLVMEHLLGRDLSTVLAEQGRLAVSEAVEYTIQACAALAAAHACGVVHRDIKPENLFLVENEGVSTVKLLDFGISRVALTGLGADPNAVRLTGTLTLGTPLYMSPEQIRSTASADGQSDLWSLGVVLYELLTGSVPFLAGGVSEICAAILEKAPPPLGHVRPDLPPALVEVVERCLQKDPAQRYRNVSELAVALLAFAPSRSLAVAESSSAIRRAAIEAVGLGGDGSGRVTAPSLNTIGLRSALQPAAVSGISTPTSSGSRGEGQSEPGAARLPARGRMWLAVGGVAVSLTAIVAIFASRGARTAVDAAGNRLATASAIALPSARMAPPSLVTETLAPPATDERLSDPAPEPHPSARAAATGTRPAAPWTPPSQSVLSLTAPRAPQPSKSATAPAASESSAPAAPVTPLVTPGRPDLGY